MELWKSDVVQHKNIIISPKKALLPEKREKKVTLIEGFTPQLNNATSYWFKKETSIKSRFKHITTIHGKRLSQIFIYLFYKYSMVGLVF